VQAAADRADRASREKRGEGELIDDEDETVT
jgi:hypothetical protein